MDDSAVRYVGIYFGHRIRLAEEAGRWRILFDPIIGGVYGKNAERLGFIETPWDDDTTYQTAEDAKRTALKLAQDVFWKLGHRREMQTEIEWRAL
jgi:hypothetical protein